MAKTSMDNKVVILGVVILLCEYWGRVHTWVHLAVAALQRQKRLHNSPSEVCLKQTPLVMGKIFFKGYLPNTPQFEINTRLYYFSE